MRDYIEEAQLEAKLRFGRELSPDEMAEMFIGHGKEARIQHLKNLNTPEAMTLKEAAERMEYESALRHVHDQLMQADR